MTPLLTVPDGVEREDLAVFVTRAVRLDASVAVRLRADGPRVAAWAGTPFDALVTRAVHGTLEPRDVTVVGSDLLAALSVVGGASVDPGHPVNERWHGPLPGGGPWVRLDDVPGDAMETLADRGVAAAREDDPSGRPSAALLDQVVLTVSGEAAGRGDEARVPMRCVFALAGMGFLGAGAGPVRVSVGGDWLRLDAHGGAVLRRRRRASLDLRPV